MNNIYFILIAIAIFIYITAVVRKKKLSTKDGFWWFIGSLIILFLAIFPYSINWLAEVFGISYPPALFLTLCCVFLLLVNFRSNCISSKQQNQIIELEEQLSILKHRVDDMNKKAKYDKDSQQ